MSLSTLYRFALLDREHRDALGPLQAEAPTLFREARDRLGISQAELAERLGVYRSTIEKIISRQRKPSPGLLVSLAEVLQYDGLRRAKVASENGHLL